MLLVKTLFFVLFLNQIKSNHIIHHVISIRIDINQNELNKLK